MMRNHQPHASKIAAKQIIQSSDFTMKTTVFLALLIPSALAFAPNSAFVARPSTSLPATIAEGVEFDTVAREWRCKWSDDGDKASLVAAQKALESVLPEVKKVDGVKGVERIVCGECLDLKVITSLTADKYGEWEEKGFPPEKDFLDMLKDIDGISFIETQTFTKMPV